MKLDSTISAVVTGGASGLGEQSVRALSALGVKVAIFDRDPSRGKMIADELGVGYCEVDVTSDASVDAGFARARELHGQERILINCAGGGNAIRTASRHKETGEIRHFPVEKFDWVCQVNLVGTFRCIAKSAAGMLTLDPLEDGERGVIINTASVAAEDGQPGQAAYSASKAGIVGMTLTIARDMAPEGIRCNTILPGVFNTPAMAGARDETRRALSAQVPFPKRLGEPHEFASLALEMCRNTYFNGEDVRLDGAIRMNPR